MMKWLQARRERKRLNDPKVQRQLKAYWEGRRLMRVGDGADEFIGNHIAFAARAALNELGYDPDGTRPDLRPIERPMIRW